MTRTAIDVNLDNQAYATIKNKPQTDKLQVIW